MNSEMWNGDWVAPQWGRKFRHCVSAKAAPASRPVPTFFIEPQSAAPGQIVTAAIRASALQELTSVQFTLRWDPAVLQFVSLGEGGLSGANAGNFNTPSAKACDLFLGRSGGRGSGDSIAARRFLHSLPSRRERGSATSALAFPMTPTVRELTIAGELAAAQWQNGSVTLAGSLPRGVLVRAEGDGVFRIRFAGAPGRTYLIECSETLSPAQWIPLGSVVADAQGWFEYVDDSRSRLASRFYRAVQR
jgi:hypothetical protein